MTNLKQIIKELEKDPDDVEARILIEMFKRELEQELAEALHSRPLRPVTAETLRRVIGEDDT
jgi:uncharacterized protein Yka (UPF0111/DUF47 family)